MGVGLKGLTVDFFMILEAKAGAFSGCYSITQTGVKVFTGF